jgi:hypothetical protein
MNAAFRSLASRSLVALSLGAAACQAGPRAEGGAAPVAVAAAAPGLAITARAETGAITAIAYRAPLLYAGTTHGLRRWDVTTDEYETLGPDEGLLGHGVTALGLDGAHDVWVATDAGVGRFTAPEKGKPKYQAMGGLAGITAIAPTTDGRSAWAGGGDGLYHSDGTSWSPVVEVHGAGVTSLDLDRDGKSAWVGTRALGLFFADEAGGGHARSVSLGDDRSVLDEIVGTALTAAGTRVVAGHAADGGRVVFLEGDEPQAFRPQPDLRLVRLVDTGNDAVLVAGPVGEERAYKLQLLRAGEERPAGGLRFVSVKKGTPGARSKDRWVAAPLDALPPPGVTVAVGGEGDVFYGTARRGVARGAKGRPAYLSGAELVGDAERLHVACVAKDRCFAVTDGPQAWLTDGDVYRETGVVITRLAAPAKVPAAEGGVDQWKSFQRVPLVLPAGTSAGVSFAEVSPEGVLWFGLRARGQEGDAVSIGAVELELTSHHVVQHRALAAGEKGTPDMLPLPPAVTGVLFDEPALWFSSLAGVRRWQQGELRGWGENEGLRSELVHAVAKAPGDAIWAATSEGVATFDGKTWRMRGDGEDAIVACRGLVRDGHDGMWVATAKGLRLVTPADARALGQGDVVVEGDLLDVSVDRYGRVWALSNDSITVVAINR